MVFQLMIDTVREFVRRYAEIFGLTEEQIARDVKDIETPADLQEAEIPLVYTMSKEPTIVVTSEDAGGFQGEAAVCTHFDDAINKMGERRYPTTEADEIPTAAAMDTDCNRPEAQVQSTPYDTNLSRSLACMNDNNNKASDLSSSNNLSNGVFENQYNSPGDSEQDNTSGFICNTSL